MSPMLCRVRSAWICRCSVLVAWAAADVAGALMRQMVPAQVADHSANVAACTHLSQHDGAGAVVAAVVVDALQGAFDPVGRSCSRRYSLPHHSRIWRGLRGVCRSPSAWACMRCTKALSAECRRASRRWGWASPRRSLNSRMLQPKAWATSA